MAKKDYPREFIGDDEEYFNWLRKHPEGYVINTQRKIDPEYMIIHSAQCWTINRYKGKEQPGGFTERQYIKICSPSIESLRVWCQRNGRSDGSFSQICSKCAPV